jgi:hypothetical protein
MVGLYMNRKGFGRKRSWRNRCNAQEFGQTEIRTKRLWNMSPELYTTPPCCFRSLTWPVLFFNVSHRARLSPRGTAATVWPTVPAPDDRWWWVWSNRWNANWQGKPKYSEETCPSTTLSPPNPTWPDPGSNPNSWDGKPVTNGLRPVWKRRCF